MNRLGGLKKKKRHEVEEQMTKCVNHTTSINVSVKS